MDPGRPPSHITGLIYSHVCCYRALKQVCDEPQEVLTRVYNKCSECERMEVKHEVFSGGRQVINDSLFSRYVVRNVSFAF